MEKHRNQIKEKIKVIYDDSRQNYGAPKITKELHKQGETIAEKTVGNYMRQIGIKAQWVKPYTVTTMDSDFSQSKLQLRETRCCMGIRDHVSMDV